MEMDHDHHIDALLERYLHLLHEYTSLREQLSALQAGMYQDLARANFAAERGMRFGADQYDERMRASRRVSITPSSALDSDGDVPVRFAVFRAEDEDGDGGEGVEHTATGKEAHGETKDETQSSGHAGHATRRRRNDPLNWFGLLTPLPLRQAQDRSVRAVEYVIPRLAAVGGEMARLEIEVRRARKRRAKMGKAAAAAAAGLGSGGEEAKKKGEVVG
ncbi:hypothetical protein F4810DRAFT_456300 [Camillea tinctor]|nr:hypothetical protein F4810DRAFT_456300 [Camillea tinctor]